LWRHLLKTEPKPVQQPAPGLLAKAAATLSATARTEEEKLMLRLLAGTGHHRPKGIEQHNE
jgi:hypothetical protein